MTCSYKKFLALSALTVLSCVPLVSLAQSTPQGSASTPAGLTNPLNATDLPTLLNEVLSYVVQIGTIFLTLMLIYVGFLFVAARGNEEKVQSARTALLWTVVGGLILLGAKAIAVAIASSVSSL